MKIKKGDNVIVTTGADKGKSGKVIKAMPRMDMVVVDGVNMKKKSRRGRTSKEAGQTLEIAMPVHVSNVKIKN